MEQTRIFLQVISISCTEVKWLCQHNTNHQLFFLPKTENGELQIPYLWLTSCFP